MQKNITAEKEFVTTSPSPRLPNNTERDALLSFILANEIPCEDNETLVEVQSEFNEATIAVFDKATTFNDKIIFLLWPQIYDEYAYYVYTMSPDGSISRQWQMTF